MTQGLTTEEAQRRLVAEGPNEVGGPARRTAAAISFDVVREPMFLLLLAGGATYLAIGDLLEAVVLSVFACASVAITIFQEVRSERALEALRSLAAPRARVVRDGMTVEVPAREVARGDVLALDAGDRIAADAVLAGDAALEVDEALLTGESMAVLKAAGVDPALSAGTLVTQGAARALVTATGSASAIGRIAGALASLDMNAPRLREETRGIVRLSALGGAVVALAVLLVHGLARDDWSTGMLSGVAVGMALLPEEFAVVLAVYLAMGARRLSAVGVLTRRAAAIESLGAATVLCTDKTGTLTENRMRVAGWWSPGVCSAEAEGALRLMAARACMPGTADPMDLALQANGAAAVQPVLGVFALRRDLLAVGVARDVGGATAEVAVKGAPEAVLSLCAMRPDKRAEVAAQVASMAASGQRVLAVARAAVPKAAIPDRLDDVPGEFLGLVGLIDPVRPEVPDAVARLRGAGIRVVMITGDHPATAQAIARQAGIANGGLLLGSELEGASDQALAARLAGVTVIARVSPDQKLRIVRALRAAGEVTAMIGDGVNDAPALRAADIGVAMGQRGTDVAREAGDIVLLDDRFSSIPDAVRLGRRIYDNIRKAAGFVVSVHVPIAGLALLPLFTGAPALLGPLHIALLEIIIDPTCALVFEAEPEAEDVMARPPRAPEAKLIDLPLLGWSGALGAAAFAAAAAVAWVAGPRGSPVELRTAVFLVLVSTVVGLVALHLGGSRIAGTTGDRRLATVVAVVAALAILAVGLPPVRAALGLALPNPEMMGVAAAGVFGFALAGGLLAWLGAPVHSRSARRESPG